MRLSRLFFFTCKNYLKKPFFVIALLLLPFVGVFLSSRIKDEEPELIRVALYVTEGEDTDEEDLADTEWLVDSLLDSEGSFSFYVADSKDTLCNDVLTGKAECGYIIPDNLFGLYKDTESDGAVAVITGAKSTIVTIVNEHFYSVLFQRLSRVMLLNYLSKYSVLEDSYPKVFDKDDVYALHQKYMENAVTFRINYDNKPEAYIADKTELMLSPFRGLFAILILSSGFIGALTYYRSAKHPVFKLFRVRLVQILVPMLFSGAVVLLCLYLFPNMQDVAPGFSGVCLEAGKLLLYILACLVFLLILSSVIRSERLFYAVFPLYLLGCLVFSPVFVDIGQYVPVLRTLTRLFLPTWYL